MENKLVSGQDPLELRNKCIALQEQHFLWMMDAETCTTEKTLTELAKLANLTPADLEKISNKPQLKEVLENLKFHNKHTNTFIRFNRAFQAVDRILKNENLREGTKPLDFDESNIIYEAGMTRLDLYGDFDCNIVSRDLGSLLTLKALSAERYLKLGDLDELGRLEYIKAICDIRNHEFEGLDKLINFRIDRKIVNSVIGLDFLYLPPKHAQMLNGGEKVIDVLIHPLLVYKKYLKLKAELPEGKKLVEKDIVVIQGYNTAIDWLALMLAKDRGK